MRPCIILIAASLYAEVRIPEPPLGLDLYMPVPEANPLTPEKVALGRKLFFDKALSRGRTVSCATCHDPERAFSDGRALARGIGGADGHRSSPAIVNRGYGKSFFWDGRVATLEQQVLEPILNPRELGLKSIAELEARADLTAQAVAEALASYIRTIRSGNSRVDRHIGGDAQALSEVERRGIGLFRGKANCVACHVGPNFSDEQFHNTGIAWRDGAFADEGRFAVTRREADRGAFKTPTLREVGGTAPYMHDGSIATLEAVIDYYNGGGRRNPHLAPDIRPLNLTPEERRALAAFLRALTGEIREGWR